MFTVVRTEHKDCAECDSTASFAVAMARVSGSSRSSYGDGNGHRASVVKGS